jgi:hypothetical protein
MEQRIVVKFCFELWKTAFGKNNALISAFNDNVMLRMCYILQWFSGFEHGYISVANCEL